MIFSSFILLSIPFQGRLIFKYIIGGSEEVAAAQITKGAFLTEEVADSHGPLAVLVKLPAWVGWGSMGEVLCRLRRLTAASTGDRNSGEQIGTLARQET